MFNYGGDNNFVTDLIFINGLLRIMRTRKRFSLP